MLRDYQIEMLDRLKRAWKRQQSVMVQMPTGTGKTHLMAAVIRSLTPGPSPKGEGSSDQGGMVLVVAHRRELIEQISRTLDAFGIEHGLIVSGKPIDETKQVQVASIQTLARRGLIPANAPTRSLSLFTLHFSLVIVDEAHHALAKTYKMLWEWWPKAQFLGLTATPCRLSGEAFTDLFDALLQSWSIKEFIRKGWLSDLDYVSVRSNSVTMSKVSSLNKRGSDGDYQTKQMANVLDVPESIEHLYLSYKKYAEGKKGIVYAINRDHAQHIAEYYRKMGVSCEVIDSKTPAEERRRIIEEYKAHEAPSGAVGGTRSLSVLVNVDIFSEGFDCPEVEFIQLARPTLSLSKFLQQLGRGMRISKGKEKVTILDQVGLYLIFGLPTNERDWMRMFKGEKRGRGKAVSLTTANEGRRASNAKELVNEEMFRIEEYVLRGDKPIKKVKEEQDEKKLGQTKLLKEGEQKRELKKPTVARVRTPRDYQEEMLECLEKAFRHSRRVLLQVPTGTGKTFIASKVIRKETGRSWVGDERKYSYAKILLVAHRPEVTGQIAQTLERNRLSHVVVNKKDIGPLDYGNEITVIHAMNIQAFVSKIDPFYNPNLVIIDEVHAVDRSSCEALKNRFPKARMLGLTATPCREDGKMLSTLFKRMITSWSIRELTDKGWLREVEIKVIGGGAEKAGLLYQGYINNVRAKKGIVFARDNGHAKRIADSYKRHGTGCAVIGFNLTEEEREKIINGFAAGKLKVLVCTDYFSDGMRCPDVDFVQLANETNSRNEYLHQVGCAMRPGHDNEDEEDGINVKHRKLVVLDHAGLSKKFGLPTDENAHHPTPNTQHLSPTTQHLSPTTQHPSPPTKWQLRMQRLLGDNKNGQIVIPKI